MFSSIRLRQQASPRRGLTLVEPKHIVIPKEGPMKPVTVVVRQEPYLGGVVVDEQGTPISRVRLHAQFRRAGRGRRERSHR